MLVFNKIEKKREGRPDVILDGLISVGQGTAPSFLIRRQERKRKVGKNK